MAVLTESKVVRLFTRHVLRSEVRETCSASVRDIKEDLGFWFSRGPREATSEEVHRFLTSFRYRVRDYHSAGNVTSLFSNAVLSVINQDESLSSSQKQLVVGLCAAIQVRPLPTMIWADFVRTYVEDPPFVARVLTACLRNKTRLEARILKHVENYISSRRIDFSRPIMAFGYSATVVAALKALQRIDSILIKIETPELQRPGRSVSDGFMLKKVLPADGFDVKVVEDSVALDDLRHGSFGLLVMGCKTLAVRRTGRLEIVNSYGAQEFAEQARIGEIPLWVVAGSYKIWPTLAYEMHRPAIVMERYKNQPVNSMVPEDYCKLVTEDGVFSGQAFVEAYSKLTFFSHGGIPASAIRECYGTKAENLKYLEQQINELLRVREGEDEDELGRRKSSANVDFTGTRLPWHFLQAERHYEQVLQRNEKWIDEHLGEYVAIVGRTPVDYSDSLEELLERVYKEYGYGPIYVRPVTSKPIEIVLRPRGKSTRE